MGDVTGNYNGVVTGQDLSESRTTEQLIADACAKAAKADAVIFVGGLNKSDHQDCEGADRFELGLPYGQDVVIRALTEVNPNTAVVLVSGNAVAMPWVDEVKSIVQAWYIGSEAGNAIADVVFGKVNPSGKLPFTFPAKLEDNGAHALQAYSARSRTAEYKEGIFVGYRWAQKHDIKPLFAFGHGLSYTTFEYSDASISKSSMGENSSLTVKVRVRNSGKVAGKEVVQLYIGDDECSVERPRMELKGFRKVSLAPGESTEVSFTVEPEMLKYYDDTKSEWVLEKGGFTAYVGASSEDIRSSVKFTLK